MNAKTRKLLAEIEAREKTLAYWREQEREYREFFQVGDTVQFHCCVAEVHAASGQRETVYVSCNFGRIEAITPEQFIVRTHLYIDQREVVVALKAQDFDEVMAAGCADDPEFCYEKWRDDRIARWVRDQPPLTKYQAWQAQRRSMAQARAEAKANLAACEAAHAAKEVT